MSQMMAVVADETLAPVVEGVAVLSLSGDGLMLAGQQIKAKILIAQVDGLSVASGRFDLAATQTVGDVNPVIDSQNGMADAQLRVLGGKAFVKDVALIRFAGPF